MRISISSAILLSLAAFFSKEVFSYDGEKVVISCILTFVLISYFSLKVTLYEGFVTTSAKIKSEMSSMLQVRLELEDAIRLF